MDKMYHPVEWSGLVYGRIDVLICSAFVPLSISLFLVLLYLVGPVACSLLVACPWLALGLLLACSLVLAVRFVR